MKKNIIVKKNSVTYQIPPQNVVYMEKDLRRIVIHLSGMASSELVVYGGSRHRENSCLEFYGKFADVIHHLDHRFMFCHRSYIINMDEIIIMSHNQILLSSNEGIYFGKDTYRKAQKTFEEYMQRKRKEFS